MSICYNWIGHPEICLYPIIMSSHGKNLEFFPVALVENYKIFMNVAIFKTMHICSFMDMSVVALDRTKKQCALLTSTMIDSRMSLPVDDMMSFCFYQLKYNAFFLHVICR